VAKQTIVDTPSLPGITKKEMWKGMLAFDRPTWIRFLNKKSTFFITGQFFWHNLAECNAATPPSPVVEEDSAGAAACANSRARHGFRPLRAPAFATRFAIGSAATFAAFILLGGSVVRRSARSIRQPVQHGTFWAVDYIVRDDFVVNLSQRYFVTPRGHSTPIFETWGLGGFNAGRSETLLRLTYQY
jgi:hypothetical protein